MDEGGSIIDLGAQSTTPTSKLLTAAEEAERLIPALKIIRREFPKADLPRRRVSRPYGPI